MNQSNFIVNENIQFSLDDRISGINSNIALIGEPGCGKTSLIVYNMMHLLAHSHVIVDIKNKLYNLAPYFRENGYKVYHFDLVNTAHSDCYNPFQFVKKDEGQMEDISTIANYMIGESYSQKDEYWENAARLFVNSALQYTYESLPPKYRFLDKSIQLLQLMGTVGGNNGLNNLKKGGAYPLNSFKYLVDLNDKVEDNPSHAALLYNLAFNNAKDTLACVQNNLHTHLYRFYTPGIMQIFSENGIDFQSFLEQKTIIFIGIKDYDTSLHPLCAMFLTQLFQFLFRSADQFENGRLPIPVQFWLDDFGSYRISDFASLIANGRSRGIGMTIGFHSIGQIEKVYGKYDAQTILQCTSTTLFFGGDDMEGVQLVQRKTGFDTAYINDLPKRSVVFMQRGRKSSVEELYDISKEPRFAYWNYKNELSIDLKLIDDNSESYSHDSIDIEAKIDKVKYSIHNKKIPFSLKELNPLFRYFQGMKDRLNTMYEDFQNLSPYNLKFPNLELGFDQRFEREDRKMPSEYFEKFNKIHKKIGLFDKECSKFVENIRYAIALYEFLPKKVKNDNDEYLIDSLSLKKLLDLDAELEGVLYLEKKNLKKMRTRIQ